MHFSWDHNCSRLGRLPFLILAPKCHFPGWDSWELFLVVTDTFFASTDKISALWHFVLGPRDVFISERTIYKLLAISGARTLFCWWTVGSFQEIISVSFSNVRYQQMRASCPKECFISFGVYFSSNISKAGYQFGGKISKVGWKVHISEWRTQYIWNQLPSPPPARVSKAA